MRVTVQLHGHQTAGLTSDRVRTTAFPSLRLGAVLVFAERELARALLDPGTVHALDPPPARQHGNPLRRGVLMPITHLSDQLDREHYGGVAALRLGVPLEVGGTNALEPIVGQRALRLTADNLVADVKGQ